MTTTTTKASGAAKGGKRAKPPRRKSSSGGRKRVQYPDHIRAAVKTARELRQANYAGPGAKQAAAVDKAIREAGHADEPLKAIGLSERKARACASGSMERDEMRGLDGLHKLAAEIGDPWCKGRNLASLVLALHVGREPKAGNQAAAGRARQAQAQGEKKPEQPVPASDEGDDKTAA